ncbi:MFS transporter [Streptomyces albidoflavus]
MKGRGSTVLAIVLDTMGVGLFLPLTMLYFTLVTDLSVARVGALLSLATLLSLPIGLVGGELVHRLGAVRVMVLNNVLAAVGYLCYLFASGQTLIFTGMIIVAASDRIFLSSWPPFVQQLAAGERFETWFAFIEAAKAACVVAGGAMATVALAGGSMEILRLLVLINVLSSLAAAVLIVRKAPRGSPGAGSGTADAPAGGTLAGWANVLRTRSTALLVVGNFLTTPLGLLSGIAFPFLFVDRWHIPPWVVPALFTYSYVLVVLLQTPLTEALKSRPHRQVLCVSSLLSCTAMCLLALFSLPGQEAPSPAVAAGVAVLCSTILSFAGMAYFPAVNAMLMKHPRPTESGRASGLFHTGTSLAGAFAPAGITWLLQEPLALWTAMVACSVSGLLFLFTADLLMKGRNDVA